jgi:hypothetical protein
VRPIFGGEGLASGTHIVVNGRLHATEFGRLLACRREREGAAAAVK